MNEPAWLITDEDFNLITKDYEWDGYVFMLWDNGITSPGDAVTKLHSNRFEHTEADCSFCGMIDRHNDLGGGEYKCSHCSEEFGITSGTHIEYTKLKPHYWFRFAYLTGELKIKDQFVLAKDLKITQEEADEMVRMFKKARGYKEFKSYHDVIDLLLKRKKKVKLIWPSEPVTEPEPVKELVVELVTEPGHSGVESSKAVFNIDALKSVYKTSFNRDINNTPTLAEFIKQENFTKTGEIETKLNELEKKIESILDEKATKFNTDMATPSKNPTANELKYNEPKDKPVAEEIKQVSDEVKSAEERMKEYYEKKERQASEVYKKVLYENPPPLSDEELQRRKNLWRTNGRYYR
jgi:hypothetical protein